MGAVESEKNDKRNKPEDCSATNLGLLKVLQKRIVSISIKLLMLLSIVGVFYTIKSEDKFTQPHSKHFLEKSPYLCYSVR